MVNRARERGRRVAAAAAAAAILAAAPRAAAAATPPPQEYEVKAAFLYHFAHLVEWPADAAGDGFVIGVVGRDPFGATLEAVVAGKSVRSQVVRVQRFPNPAALEGARVHILVVGAGDETLEARVLSAVAGQPILTVGEKEGFAERGGIIGFRLTRDGRVAFDINLRRAERAGLRMSSQLLKLARIVPDAR